MRPPTSEDLQFLRDIRGRFEDSKQNQILEKVSYVLFSIIFPIFFLIIFAICHDSVRWIFIAFAAVTFAFAALLWRDRGLEYEFTGDEIIERRARRERNRIIISGIIEARAGISSPELFLKTGSSKMTVHIFPSLNELIQKKAAESMAKQSEAERKRYEEVNQQLARRMKWINLIVSLVIVLGGFGVFVLFVWLKSKQLKH